MADEERQGSDESDDALDELGSLLSSGAEATEDDAAEFDAADLGALALSSRPRAFEPESADLGTLVLSSRPRAAEPVAAPAPAPVPVPVPDAEPEPEPVVVRSGRSAVGLALLVGFAAGLGSGAVLFRTSGAEDRSAVVAEPAPVPATAASAAAAPSIALAAPVAPAAPPPAEPAAAAAVTPAPSLPSAPAEARGAVAAAERPHASREATAAPAAVAPPAPAAGTLTITPATAEPESSEGERTLAAAFPPPARAEPVPVGEERNMDDLLDQAFDNPAAARRERQAVTGPLAGDLLAPTPSRDQVNESMSVLLPAIRGCAMGQSGLATASIVVGSEGKVASVSVAGAPFAGAASGRCMEGVLRKARFPRFSQPTFRVKFPFAIK